MDNISILKSFPMLSRINDDELKVFAGILKEVSIEEGKNIRGGFILLINTAIYAALAYIINMRIQRIKYEEEKNRSLDNFLELPSLHYNYNFNINENQ